MAISSWTKLAPKIEYVPTRKQYYGHYLCKLTINVSGSRLVHASPKDGSLAEELWRRIESCKKYSRGGSWHSAEKLREMLSTNIDEIECLRTLKDRFKDTLKLRIEEPMVQLYTETEAELAEVARHLLPDMRRRLLTVGYPESDEMAALLREDKIIAKSARIEQRYKIMLKDGLYTREIKENALQYLLNLKNEIRIPQHTIRMLSSNHSYIWNGYLYADDTGLTTFLSLIAPGLVGKIHELVKPVK
jgi:hypothetical protein